MNLIDFLSSPWAIVPEKLLEIQAIYATHLRGEKIDIEAIESRLGRPLANDQKEYEVREGGVAVLSVEGVITNKANLFSRVSGMASAQMLQQQVESMRADPMVKSVVLDFDSPGGSVLGIPALGESIRALAAEKPTVSCCTGTMCSAGYWLGSCANAVYISGLTDYVGSIGVVATHSYNPRNSNAQTTEITAGKFKRINSGNAPLSDEGKAYIQSQVDHLYSVFVNTVAENRKTSVDAVLKNMADGRMFIGQQAIDAGLVDGVATVDQLVAKLGNEPQGFANRKKARFASATASAGVAEAEATTNDEPVLHVENHPQGESMTPEEIKAALADNPALAAEIRAEGAAAERERIKSVRDQLLPGHEALVEALAFDGKTTGPEAAAAIIAAEKESAKATAAARSADAPDPVASSPAPEGEEAEPKASSYTPPAGYSADPEQVKLHQAALAHMNDHPGMSYLDAVKSISK